MVGKGIQLGFPASQAIGKHQELILFQRISFSFK